MVSTGTMAGFVDVVTNVIDHIVHLTPPGSVKETIKQFISLGFNVIPGGVHADGLTENALVILADRAYIELISFTHPVSHYPPGSPARILRENHPWSENNGAQPGWIDFAFLGLGSSNPPPNEDTDLSEVINDRSKREGSGVTYLPTIPGGRVRPDGKELRWKITAPDASVHGRGFLPFFCGDVTDRKLRVPIEPSENTKHPNTTLGLAHIHFLTSSASNLEQFTKQITSIVGHPPLSSSDSGEEIAWELISPASRRNVDGTPPPKLILSIAKTEEERLAVTTTSSSSPTNPKSTPTLFEVALWTEKEQEPKMTPFGRVCWLAVRS